jgi:hypothetical protein
MLVNVAQINTCQFIKGRKGTYRAIVKVRAGFLSVVECKEKSGIDVFRNFKKGALKSIEFCPEGDSTWFTVFGCSGKKVVIIDEEILVEMKVGDINQNWADSNLCDSGQYKAVNATSWASNAYAMN